MNAKLTVKFYHMYRQYLLNNNLADDSAEISVEDLHDFVMGQIDDEERLSLADAV